jgi:protein-S-isoprenylcysteine O-methyltransferase Ste14
MTVLWFSWFQISFADPARLEVPAWIRYSGLAVFVVGVSLFVLSHLKLKGFRREEGLVRGGIYSKIRNPMYLGFVFWLVGLPVYLRSLVGLLSAALWISFIIYWKRLEEEELERKYEGYAEYRKKTWF